VSAAAVNARWIYNEDGSLKNTLGKINQSIWEMHQEVRRQPDNVVLRRDLVKFFHESRYYAERRDGIPEEVRSFLLLQERESICCLLIHGAGGSPAEMRKLGEYLFQQGFTVYAMRLPLEVSPDASARRVSSAGPRSRGRRGKNAIVGVNNWGVSLSESEIVIETLLSCNPNIYVFGFSFGGTIVLNLLDAFAVKGAILIAPALFGVRSGRYIALKVVRKLLPVTARRVAPREDVVLDLMERTRSRTREIQAPICVVQAADDHMISSRGFAFLQSVSRNPKSRFHLLPDGGHQLVTGERAQEVFGFCGDFIRDV
jgi:carboxylesterase